MAMIPTRRQLLGGMALAIPAGLLPLRRAAAAKPPETTAAINETSAGPPLSATRFPFRSPIARISP